MTHTDEENRLWWDSLSQEQIEELLDRLWCVSNYPNFVLSIQKQLKAGWKLTEKQLFILRKWAR